MSDANSNLASVTTARRKNADDSTGQGSAVWLVSFTDVIALMLTFFVLLYSMSDPVREKWQEKIGMAPPTMKPYAGQAQQAGVHEGININRMDFENADNLDYVEALLKENITGFDPESGVEMRRLTDRIEFVISVPNAFSSDGRPKVELIQALEDLAPTLNNMNNQVAIASVYNSDKSPRQFSAMQVIGRIFIEAGYKRPVALTMDGLGKAADQNTIRLVLEPLTGRRVTR